MWKDFHYKPSWESLRFHSELGKNFDTRTFYLLNWALSDAPKWFTVRIFISASENKLIRLFKLDSILCISCGMSGGTVPLAKVRDTDMVPEGLVYNLMIINFVVIKFLTLKRDASLHWERISSLFLCENILLHVNKLQSWKMKCQNAFFRVNNQTS